MGIYQEKFHFQAKINWIKKMKKLIVITITLMIHML